jgi:SNF2 family DNA or RNA helicase
MGLGKTVITIAAIERLVDEGLIGGGLLIVPSSLKYQWAREVEKFTNGANILVIDGTPKQRKEQYLQVMAGQIEYCIMNFEQVVKDWKIVENLPRDYIVVDEATYIKSPGAGRTKAVRRLDAEYKWALTGQVIENRAEEAFHIMRWVDPDVFGDFRIFDTTFIARDSWGKVKWYKNLPLMHKTLAEAMFRATWADPGIREQMPKINEDTHLVSFDEEGARLYRYIVSDALFELSQMRVGSFDLTAHYMGQGAHDLGAGVVMSRVLALRMLCDHPDLLRWSANTFKLGGSTGSVYCSELQDAGRLKKKLKEPKLEVARDLITEILEEDPKNKIVVFSYFKYMLGLLQDITYDLTKSVLFTGDMNAKQKDRAKTQFQTDPSTRLFLSSDAGGYGVDLPQANYLISCDLPWSAGAWNQRNARIIRLSSEFEHVTVISLIMAGSIEERQHAMLTQKQSISQAIVDGRGADAKGKLSLSLESLTKFLVTSSV